MFLFIYNIYKSKVFAEIKFVNYNCVYICIYLSHNMYD